MSATRPRLYNTAQIIPSLAHATYMQRFDQSHVLNCNIFNRKTKIPQFHLFPLPSLPSHLLPIVDLSLPAIGTPTSNTTVEQGQSKGGWSRGRKPQWLRQWLLNSSWNKYEQLGQHRKRGLGRWIGRSLIKEAICMINLLPLQLDEDGRFAIVRLNYSSDLIIVLD